MSDSKRRRLAQNLPRMTPKEFLKARRPERFSDSVPSDTPILDRKQLEYHLHTITNRNQETPFANFARRLCAYTICPNLLPQTGPTGGGDSKVDSETFPVSEAIARGWYTAISQEASSERWGFAFSAIKEWERKVAADIQKAVDTGRGYKRVFFVSNQFIRDKKRGEVEDSLSKKHAIDVRILDRSWILDRIFEDHLEHVAIEELQIAVPAVRDFKKGPRDIARQHSLDALEENIQRTIREQREGLRFVDDCLEAADLARQLEKPRTTIDGLYERAEQVATKFGTTQQQFSCAYEKAKTSIWWHEDYPTFSDLYEEVERRARDTDSAYELELLFNLWTQLQAAVRQGHLNDVTSLLEARTTFLTGKLDKMAAEEGRPSAALHARTLRLHMDLFLGVTSNQSVDPILREFKEIVSRCDGLVGFPLEPLTKILLELGDIRRKG
jgi:hypothetical protein